MSTIANNEETIRKIRKKAEELYDLCYSYADESNVVIRINHKAKAIVELAEELDEE